MNNKRIIKTKFEYSNQSLGSTIDLNKYLLNHNQNIKSQLALKDTRTINSRELIKQKDLLKSKEIITVNPNTQRLHPISSQLINPTTLTNPICLTKFQILNNKTEIWNTYKCKTNNNDYKSFLFVPPIGLTAPDIIKIYDVDSIDKLYNWLNKHLDITDLTNNLNVNYLTLVRLVNCWIRVNFETLKNYNNILIKIISKIFTFYWGDDVNIPEINKEISNYIDYWMNKKSDSEFRLNIIDDFNSYIIKKFKLKSNT